jgi:hypothetical protein
VGKEVRARIVGKEGAECVSVGVGQCNNAIPRLCLMNYNTKGRYGYVVGGFKAGDNKKNRITVMAYLIGPKN